MDCDYPFQVKLKQPRIRILANGQQYEDDYSFVPCGRCSNCMKTRIQSWVFRLEQELKVSETSRFMTLTYNDLHLPYTKTGLPTLVKQDLQKFFKRLRHYQKTTIGKNDLERGLRLANKPIKYYAVGEYGEDGRPHYHIILYNVGSLESIYNAWDKGIIHNGTVTPKSMAYCAAYINKMEKTPIKGSDQLPQFSLMSKGLGAEFMTEEIRDNIRDVNNYVITGQGHKIAIPRYYKNAKQLTSKLSGVDLITLRHKGIDARKEREAKLRKKYGNDYDKLVSSGKLTRALMQKIDKKLRK